MKDIQTVVNESREGKPWYDGKVKLYFFWVSPSTNNGFFLPSVKWYYGDLPKDNAYKPYDKRAYLSAEAAWEAAKVDIACQVRSIRDRIAILQNFLSDLEYVENAIAAKNYPPSEPQVLS